MEHGDLLIKGDYLGREQIILGCFCISVKNCLKLVKNIHFILWEIQRYDSFNNWLSHQLSGFFSYRLVLFASLHHCFALLCVVGCCLCLHVVLLMITVWLPVIQRVIHFLVLFREKTRVSLKIGLHVSVFSITAI